MYSNIAILTQPRCGGHMTLKVFEKIYPSHNNLYEHFDWRKKETIPQLIEQALDLQPFILKFTWWDVKNYLEEISKLPADFYYLKRTDPFEMVASSYLAHISGIYHKKSSDRHTPLTNVTIPINFLEHFFDKSQPGGWYFNLENNNPMIPFIKYKTLIYCDDVTPSNMFTQITGKDKNIEIDFQKLYNNKFSTILNVVEVKDWILQNVE